jgi:hypothetical protein
MQLRIIKYVFVFCFLFLFKNSFGQKEHNIWYFGDNAGVNFNTTPPTPLLDGKTISFEPSATISDNNGNLLFYAGGDSMFCSYASVWNRNHNIMQNGDSINCNSSITQGLLILPYDNFGRKFYLFSIGTEMTPYPKVIATLEYSIIDMNKNGGLGALTKKNTILFADYATSDTMVSEKMTAVKHANGRDYWLIAHLYGQPYYPLSYTPYWYGDLNTFVKYLVTPYGIKGPFYQSIGSYTYSQFTGQMKFNEQGDKLTLCSEYMHQTSSFPTFGQLDLFDFDRCTGLLSNYQYIGDNPSINSKNNYYGCSFSPSGKVLYVSCENNGFTNYLYQFDLTSINILSTKTSIWSQNNGSTRIGQLSLAPDGKIYISNASGNYAPNNLYDTTNMNLSVINNPDILGLGCNFFPYSFSLGGKRTFYGLPSTPIDNLGKIEGGPCDTIVNENSFNLFPNPNNGTFNFTYYFDSNIIPSMEIYNSMGQIVYKYPFEETGFGDGNITLNLSNGMYYCRIIGNETILFRNKFIVAK